MPDRGVYFRILGVEPGATAAAIKKAYHARVRQCHPDLKSNQSAEDCHLRMVRLNEAYCRLMKASRGGGLCPEDPAGCRGESESVPERDALVPYKDPAYAYYKRGHRLFTRIHPSSWFWSGGSGASARFPHKIDAASMAASIERILDLIPWAYYYFGVVVDRYPESPWYVDSKVKIRKIERLAPIYVRILHSYRRKKSRSA